MLSAEQIAQFHHDGLLFLRGVFRGEELAALQAATEAVRKEAVAGDGQGHGYRGVGGRRQWYRTDGVLWERWSAFRIASMNPELLAAVSQCIGHPFMPINDSLVVKLPHSGVSIPWHQDPPYQGPEGRRSTFGVPNFDVDIYLDQATVDNGCLYALAGHHLAGHVELERLTEEELYERPDAVPLEMEPGDVLFHAITAPHGSRANDSDTLRRVFYVHYMAREVLEELHPEWIGSKRGFGEGDVEGVQAWIDERVAAGLDDPATRSVRLTAGGFVFSGQPATPPRHWEALIGSQSTEQLRAVKTLAVEPVRV